MCREMSPGRRDLEDFAAQVAPFDTAKVASEGWGKYLAAFRKLARSRSGPSDVVALEQLCDAIGEAQELRQGERGSGNGGKHSKSAPPSR